MTALERKTTWLAAGYYLGHPGLGPDPRRDPSVTAVLTQLLAAARYSPPFWFHDLEAVTMAAIAAGGTVAPHGLWVPNASLGALCREVADTPLRQLLQRRDDRPPPASVASGHDVIGFGGEMMLPFTREDAGRQLCEARSLPLEPPPFLPDEATARRLAALLNDDELGAPVLWVRCWRTVHTVL